MIYSNDGCCNVTEMQQQCMCDLDDDGNPNGRKKVIIYVEYDHLRTMKAIYQDYLGLSPIFYNTLFQWIFLNIMKCLQQFIDNVPRTRTLILFNLERI